MQINTMHLLIFIELNLILLQNFFLESEGVVLGYVFARAQKLLDLAAEAKLKAQIKTAWPSLDALRGKAKKKGKLTFTTDLAKMAAKAEFIHEAAPEREELKIKPKTINFQKGWGNPVEFVIAVPAATY